jgi:hypothetical protein
MIRPLPEGISQVDNRNKPNSLSRQNICYFGGSLRNLGNLGGVVSRFLRLYGFVDVTKPTFTRLLFRSSTD